MGLTSEIFTSNERKMTKTRSLLNRQLSKKLKLKTKNHGFT
jgi:hypothetical protein